MSFQISMTKELRLDVCRESRQIRLRPEKDLFQKISKGFDIN